MENSQCVQILRRIICIACSFSMGAPVNISRVEFFQVTKLLHENIVEQFEFRCQETQVSFTFDKVELLVEEQTVDTLPADEACIKDAKGKVSTLKMDEIQYLKSLLQQVEEHNSCMESQIQSLKQNMDRSNAMNAVEKLRSWNSCLSSAPHS